MGEPLLTVDSVRFVRQEVLIEGVAAPGLIELAQRGPIQAVLYDGRDDSILPLPALTLTPEGRVSARYSSLAIDGCYPLKTGDYLLMVRQATSAEVFPSAVDASFRVEGMHLGLKSTGRYRYWTVPARDPQTGALRLSVFYRRIGGGKPKRRSLSARQAHLAEQVFTLIHRWSGRLVRRTGRRVLFTSDSRASLSGNLQVIHDRMIERGLDKDYDLATVFKESITAKRPLRDRVRLPYLLAVCDIIICDDYHPVLYKVDYDPSVRLIQVWHASGAFKTVGYSRVGKPGGPLPFSKNHRNYTYALVSSMYDGPFYAEAFGIPLSHVVPTGIPRMDAFFDDAHKAAQRSAARAAFPLIVGKKVIFFAPTFRGTGPSTAFYDYDRIDFAALHQVCVELDAVVVFKMHPFVIEPVVIPAEYADRFVDATSYREINDLLMVADVVITDYSTVAFEASTLGTPMLFFAYDLEEYISERDFYVPYEEFVPGKIVHTFAEVLASLRTSDFEQWKVPEFAAKHFAHLDGGSTDRVIDQLILGTEPVDRCAPLEAPHV